MRGVETAGSIRKTGLADGVTGQREGATLARTETDLEALVASELNFTRDKIYRFKAQIAGNSLGYCQDLERKSWEFLPWKNRS